MAFFCRVGRGRSDEGWKGKRCGREAGDPAGLPLSWGGGGQIHFAPCASEGRAPGEFVHDDGAVTLESLFPAAWRDSRSPPSRRPSITSARVPRPLSRRPSSRYPHTPTSTTCSPGTRRAAPWTRCSPGSSSGTSPRKSQRTSCTRLAVARGVDCRSRPRPNLPSLIASPWFSPRARSWLPGGEGEGGRLGSVVPPSVLPSPSPPTIPRLPAEPWLLVRTTTSGCFLKRTPDP